MCQFMWVKDEIFAQLRQVDVYLTGFAQRAGSTCTVTKEKTLKCKFPENINESQKDFSLYFYHDKGGEGNFISE